MELYRPDLKRNRIPHGPEPKFQSSQVVNKAEISSMPRFEQSSGSERSSDREHSSVVSAVELNQISKQLIIFIDFREINIVILHVCYQNFVVSAML